MWRSFWTCRIVPQECFPVERLRDEHPGTTREPPPLCTDHNEPMVLRGWEEKREPELKGKRVRRRPGGFGSQQMELFGG